MEITKLENIKNNYETTFISVPEMSESEYKEVVEKFVSMIKDNGGSIVNLEQWGLKNLAYEIKRRTKGYYAFIEFIALPTFIGKIEQEYIYDERVLRYLTVKPDKHQLAYNKKRRELGFGGNRKKEEKTL
jgi:small subunit ribosomal protein S6